MPYWIESRDSVEIFLNNMKNILLNYGNLIIVKEQKADDKTFKFIVKYLGKNYKQIIFEELLNIDITNYCYTTFDDNPFFNKETFWIFGKMFGDNFLNMIEVYIKIKIKHNNVICMSFHEKEYDLKYPYLSY